MKYLFIIMFLFGFLHAHKVNLFINNDKGIIDIYSYFANGSACKNCSLIIKHKDKILIDDKLNTRGEYQYKSKFKTLEVIVDATGGHRVSQNITIDSIENKNLQIHLKSESFIDNIKIVFGLILIFTIFFILKKFKK